jgi:hypothetical protein
VVQTIAVADTEVVGQGTPPISTVAAVDVEKSVPVMVTVVEPLLAPAIGDTDVITGAAKGVPVIAPTNVAD